MALGKPLDPRLSIRLTYGVYPGPNVLEEIGRIAVAASRLDAAMGRLWAHLDRSLDESDCQRKPASAQVKGIRITTEERLFGDLKSDVLSAVDAAKGASERRNALMHQEWLIRGDHVMRPVSELEGVQPELLEDYLEDWAREARDADHWQIANGRSQAIGTAQTLTELVAMEKDLRSSVDRITSLTFAVASSRETGSPLGYRHQK